MIPRLAGPPAVRCWSGRTGLPAKQLSGGIPGPRVRIPPSPPFPRHLPDRTRGIDMTEIQGPVRVRFAPSPTGFLHVGGVRTAIYNELLRLHAGGAFILRIEDTDKARSDEAMTRQIQDALSWTGIRWDEGPFLQSERLPRHAERGRELLAADRAYRCFCTTEELEAQRAEAQKAGSGFHYPRTCARLAP